MKTTIQSLMVVLFIAASTQTHAQGLVFDQQSDNGLISTFNNGVDGFYIQTEPLTQSFIPSLSAIGFVQFEFEDVPGNGNNGATVAVNLWTGSPNVNSATLLGSTTPVYMPNGFMNNNLGFAGVTNFFFSTPITLTAGQTYYLQPVVLSGDNPWAIIVLTNTYPNGQLYGSGFAEQPGSDLWFREGIASVPEPSILAFATLGCFLVLGFKGRSKLIILLLFTIPVLSIHAADSIVQATAEEAGLTQVSSASVPDTGTFWIMTVGSDGELIESPDPFLPPSLSNLPIYSAGGDKFIVDNTGGQLTLSSSAKRVSNAQAASIVQTQATDMANLIDLMETNDDSQQSFQPNFTPMLDTNGLWLEISNETPNVGLRLHNTIGLDNYQLLFTTNLQSGWNLGEILFSASAGFADFTPVPRTNSMMFFLAQYANPVFYIQDNADSEELNPTNTSDPGHSGSFFVQNIGSATGDVPVYYSIGGTAQGGIDYSNLSGSVIIPVNQGYAFIEVDPIADGLKPDQTIVLTLLQNTNYLIDPANDSATNILTANPQVYPIAHGDIETPCPNTLWDIQLNANDPQGLPLTYTILTYPTHGNLTGTPPSMTYTATNCYEGQDSFTFQVSDGQHTSTPASVTLIVTETVTANPVYRLTSRGAPVSFTLSGSFGCDQITNFMVLNNPTNGTLSGTLPNLTYTPNVNFTGVDTFNYLAYHCEGATNTVNVFSVPGLTLSTECDPFGTAPLLEWSLDDTVLNWPGFSYENFIVYRSTVSGGPYTAIATNYNFSTMSYFDVTAVPGQTNYYVMTYNFTDPTTGNAYESPFSNELALTGHNPQNLISADAIWNVVMDMNNPSSVTNLQAPFSSFGTNQYPGVYAGLNPLPHTFWPLGTTWSNHITLFIPTNSVVLSNVQYSAAIDNDYSLYVNGSANPIGEGDNAGTYAVWSPFQSFPDNILHYGTNDIGVVIQDMYMDPSDIDYFSMVVTTNTCGQ